MEQSREAYWLRYPNTSPMKLRWRAVTVRHSFHILPGESIVEFGAGSGLWTEHLANVLRGENPITAAVFNHDLLLMAKKRQLPNVAFTSVIDLTKDLPAEAFDYAVGTAILCHDQYPQTLQALWRALKPGGQILFFEANYWNPQVFLKNAIPPLGRWTGEARCQIGLRKYRLMHMASQQGFTHVDVIPQHKDAGVEALQELAAASRPQPGNVRFEVWQQANRGNHFAVVETWSTRRRFDAHLMAADTREFRSKLAVMTGALYDERLYRLLT